MNWKILRHMPWIDTRSSFVFKAPPGGALLDIGSSDGATLGHFAELRPDLRLFSTDIAGSPEKYPRGCEFFRGDIQKDRLPWADGSFDLITCMQLVEHLSHLEHLFEEVARVLKPGGKIFFETPHPKTVVLASAPGGAAGTFTMNFFDDPTHTRPMPVGTLAQRGRNVGLQPVKSGISRNWIFAAAWPVYFFCAPSRKKFTAQVNWIGWSAYLIAQKPPKA